MAGGDCDCDNKVDGSSSSVVSDTETMITYAKQFVDVFGVGVYVLSIVLRRKNMGYASCLPVE